MVIDRSKHRGVMACAFCGAAIRYNDAEGRFLDADSKREPHFNRCTNWQRGNALSQAELDICDRAVGA